MCNQHSDKVCLFSIGFYSIPFFCSFSAFSFYLFEKEEGGSVFHTRQSIGILPPLHVSHPGKLQRPSGEGCGLSGLMADHHTGLFHSCENLRVHVCASTSHPHRLPLHCSHAQFHTHPRSATAARWIRRVRLCHAKLVEPGLKKLQ